jgi:hypothetical protein
MKSKSVMWMEFLNIVLATLAVSMIIVSIGIYTEIK